VSIPETGKRDNKGIGSWTYSKALQGVQHLPAKLLTDRTQMKILRNAVVEASKGLHPGTWPGKAKVHQIVEKVGIPESRFLGAQQAWDEIVGVLILEQYHGADAPRKLRDSASKFLDSKGYRLPS